MIYTQSKGTVSMNNENKTNHRYIKVVSITYSEIRNGKANDVLNTIIDIIHENGGNFVALTTQTIGVGVTSPVFLIYNIIYNASHAVPESQFKKVRNLCLA